MSEEELVERIRAKQLSPDTPLVPPDWRLWQGRRRLKLWEATALSLGYDPNYRFQASSFVAQASTEPVSHAPREKSRLDGDVLAGFHTIELLKRLQRNQGFVLRLVIVVDRLGDGSLQEQAVTSVENFVRLANEEGWHLPVEFPGQAPTATSASPAPAVAMPEAVPVPSSAADKEARQRRRYRMCIDAGLQMPTDTYASLPRGIKEVAKREGITRQAFAEDVKAHIGRLHGR